MCFSVKLLKTLGSFWQRPPAESYCTFKCVCVSTTRDFCCLSEDWRAANAGPAHSSHNQAQVMFFHSFSFANK